MGERIEQGRSVRPAWVTGGVVVLCAALAAGSLGACNQEDGDDAVAGGGAQAPAAPEPGRRSPVALRIERSLRDVELGTALPAAIESLRGALDDPTATAAEKDEAAIGLSRALEASGDAEGAIVAMERLLASHGGDGERWSQEEAAHRRLRLLLTGDDVDPRSLRHPDPLPPVAPFARTLVDFFRRGEGQDVEIELRVFGGSRNVSDRLGTFEVAGALRRSLHEACPLCDDEPKIHTHTSRYSDWTAIPAARAQLRSALVVFFFDLGDRRIPSRYDDLLPMPSDAIAARISRGQGLVVARQRPGAPPVLLLAAPRAGQLEAVESALAQLTAIPEAPLDVPVPATLLDDEVHEVVRRGAAPLRACSAQARVDPGVHRDLSFGLEIGADGVPTAATVRSGGAPLADGALDRCLVGALRTLRFPRAQAPTSLTIPVGAE